MICFKISLSPAPEHAQPGYSPHQGSSLGTQMSHPLLFLLNVPGSASAVQQQMDFGRAPALHAAGAIPI